MPEFIEILKNEENIKFELAELGQLNGYQIYGYTDFDQKKIVVDISLSHERERSVLFIFAHEIGHWLLHRHRPLLLGAASDYAKCIYDNESEEYWHRKERGLTTPREWIEWQANCFASALLLPEQACRLVIEEVQASIYPVQRHHGIIYLNRSEVGLRDVKSQVRTIANKFMVSDLSVRFRLIDLGLLVIQEGADFGDDCR